MLFPLTLWRVNMELTPMIGVGVSDLQHAARTEVKRIIEETKGDALAQTKLLVKRLRELDFLTNSEVEPVVRLAELGHQAGIGETSATEAYLESRRLYDELLASGKASPVALVLASSAVGSYSTAEASDGSGSVIFAKRSNDWEHRGAAAGAIIGGAIGGVAGAAIGGAVGGIVGAAVDECTD
jgi:hypothetical protein